jgi:hypothetical protein
MGIPESMSLGLQRKIRIVEEGTICRGFETLISWNQEGVQGETGPQGPEGSQGPQGETGLSGNTILNGVGVPTDEDPENALVGDFYMDTGAWCIYGPLTADGWGTGHPLQADGTCEQDTDTTKVVFVTSGRYTGNLGGVDGADAKCQAEADAAGLTGEYKAWISDEASSPAAAFTKNGGPYVLAGTGTHVAEDWADLTDGNLAAAINIHASGNAIDRGADTWTNTTTTGDLL